MSGAAGSTASGAAGASAGSGAGTTGAAGDDGTGGSAAGTAGAAGSSVAGASGSAGSGTGGGAAGAGVAGSTGAGGSIEVPDGGTYVPASYSGTPFKMLTIPGMIYAADYDKGFSGVAFCRVGAANPPTPATCGTPFFGDWCCGAGKGCNNQGEAVCPIYRQDSTDPTKNDNAGISHMNAGEPDNWAATGPTWVVGADGNPTLTGPTSTVKTPVPYHTSMMTTDEDVYISYMFTGQWENYTVQVTAAGTYAIGGVMGTPGGTQIRFDFGSVGGTQVTTGVINVPPSPTPQTEAYHEWFTVSNMGTVTFPAAGTYLMRFTLVAQQFNPLYFTFSKM